IMTIFFMKTGRIVLMIYGLRFRFSILFIIAFAMLAGLLFVNASYANDNAALDLSANVKASTHANGRGEHFAVDGIIDKLNFWAPGRHDTNDGHAWLALDLQ